MTNAVNHSRQVAAGPWYRQVSKEQWKAFNAAFWGWVLDGFDFTLLMFVLIDIQESFTVDSALAGALGTVTMMTRLVGGVAAGTAADRWGRKGPLMVSILWFSIFSLLSGFSTSYAMLFAFRALFGIGMGGEYAAGVPLAMEHWPTHLRGIASGILQGGFFVGVHSLGARFPVSLSNLQHAARAGLARPVLDRRAAGASRALDPQWRVREPGMARAPAASESNQKCRTYLAAAGVSPRPARDHDSDVTPYQRIHAVGLFGFVLVSHVSPAIPAWSRSGTSSP